MELSWDQKYQDRFDTYQLFERLKKKFPKKFSAFSMSDLEGYTILLKAQNHIHHIEMINW